MKCFKKRIMNVNFRNKLKMCKKSLKKIEFKFEIIYYLKKIAYYKNYHFLL